MTDQQPGPGWWLASDGRWYPPEQAHQPQPPTAPPPGYGPPTPGSPPGYGPPGYGTPGYNPYGYPPRDPRPSVQGQATASMVVGIISAVPCCWPYSAVLALVALPLGIVSLRKIDRGEAAPDGRGQALAGIIISGIVLVLAVALVGLLVAVSLASDN